MTSCFLQADATRLPFADDTFDFVIGSPPYCDARTYGIGIKLGCVEWVEWMLKVTAEAVRVSRGLVIWYSIPGSGGEQWLRADIEYALAFTKCEGPIPWADNTANGHPPKWAPGGEMSHRLSNGSRRNQWDASPLSTGGARRKDGAIKKPVKVKPSHKINTKTMVNGHKAEQCYEPPVLANPGNLIQGIIVGGNCMGSSLCHDNEAPYPEELPKYFIRHLCPPGGKVLDPFSGSGTTVAAAVALGRIGYGTDIRASQVELGMRRLGLGVQRELF